MVLFHVIIYSMKMDRLHFLQMAVKHPVFGRFHDIRRYIAKWFFYEYVNITKELVSLAIKHYGFTFKKAVEHVQEKLGERPCRMFLHPNMLSLLRDPMFAGFDFCASHLSGDPPCVIRNSFCIDDKYPMYFREKTCVRFDIDNPVFDKVLSQFREEKNRNERKRRKVVSFENIPE